MKIFITLFLIFGLILESTLTTIPIILLGLIIATALFKSNYVFILGLVFGILFDLMTLKMVGITSIYFTVVILLVLLYQSKFEIATNNFIIMSTFLGSLSFLILQGYTGGNLIFETLLSSLIGVLLFMLLQKTNKQELKS